MAKKNKCSTFEKSKYKKPCVSFGVIAEAKTGDIEAIMLVQKHYDPYIRKLSMVVVNGTSYLNIDLYEWLKTKLTISLSGFQM